MQVTWQIICYGPILSILNLNGYCRKTNFNIPYSDAPLRWGTCQLAWRYGWMIAGVRWWGRSHAPTCVSLVIAWLSASFRWPELVPHPKPHHQYFSGWIPTSGIFFCQVCYHAAHCWTRPKVHHRSRCSRLCSHTWILDFVKQHNAIQWEQIWAACQVLLRGKVNDAPKPSLTHYEVIQCKRSTDSPLQRRHHRLYTV